MAIPLLATRRLRVLSMDRHGGYVRSSPIRTEGFRGWRSVSAAGAFLRGGSWNPRENDLRALVETRELAADEVGVPGWIKPRVNLRYKRSHDQVEPAEVWLDIHLYNSSWIMLPCCGRLWICLYLKNFGPGMQLKTWRIIGPGVFARRNCCSGTTTTGPANVSGGKSSVALLIVILPR